MKEIVFNVEEFHRGKWQALMLEDGKTQKTVKITEEQAEIMNKQSKYHNLRYVSADAKEEVKDDSNDELETLRAEYKEVIGKDPHHKKGVDSLKAEIEEAKKDKE